MKLKLLFFFYLVLASVTISFAQTAIITSIQNKDLAAKEIRRYIYLRTGNLPEIIVNDKITGGYKNYIIVANKGEVILQEPLFKEFQQVIHSLQNEEFYIKTIQKDGINYQLISGGNNTGTLYAAYTFAEKMGVRFYLEGDVIPDKKINLSSLNIDAINKPLFSIRGIQPFHDFPEGPDWWNIDDYKTIIGQLPKLKMNFIGLHTYPEGHVGPEPTVWIGTKDNVNEDGTVKFSYSSTYHNSLREVKGIAWGYAPIKTNDYYMGASDLFETDVFGADVQKNLFPWPKTPEENNQLFNNTGKLLNEAFTFARSLGVKTCIGTETPLTIPNAVKEELKAKGKNITDSEVIKELYEGMFYRIKKAYPIDYFWLWTPEAWTWYGASDSSVADTEKDIVIAYNALKSSKSPFDFATCGWVLGPPKDRVALDKLLSKDIAMSCINRNVGRDTVEPQFATISGRQKWAIPWIEEDPLLSQPQMWVGRLRKDAVDALKYGCNGLIGIHWRTRVLGPNVSALAAASWNQNGFKVHSDKRFMQPDDFYLDWATQNFGVEAANDIAKIFSGLDGVFPIPVTWIDGPGAIMEIKEKFDIEKGKYKFVDEMGGLRNKIKGNGNIERFDYWLNTFKYYRGLAEVGCAAGALKAAMEPKNLQKDSTLPKILEKIDFTKVVALRKDVVKQYETMLNYFLATVTNMSDLGTVMSLHNKNLPSTNKNLLFKYDSIIRRATGNSLIGDFQPRREYSGELKIIVQTNRTSLNKNEDLNLKVIILGNHEDKKTFLCWKTLGSKAGYKKIYLTHIARGVYKVSIPASAIMEKDFEYYITTKKNRNQVNYPSTATIINRTVIVTE